MSHIETVHNGRQIGTNARRHEFWRYCIRTEGGARARAKHAGVPFAIDRYFIDSLLVDQNWLCAISGLPLEIPGAVKDYNRTPFGPSLDRVVPVRGYVPGNLRIVCNMVNLAMNEWGLPNLLKMSWAIGTTQLAFNWKHKNGLP